MTMSGVDEIARALVADGKGILAADETPRTITKRLAARGIESTPDSRRDYREMFFRTPGVGAFISGVILQDETIRQTSASGSSPASRSTRARRRWPARRARSSPRASTGCATAWKSTASSARVSPSGAR